MSSSFYRQHKTKRSVFVYWLCFTHHKIRMRWVHSIITNLLNHRHRSAEKSRGDPFILNSLLSPPFRLDVGPLNPARGSGERCKLPQQGLWGWAPTEIEFVAFSLTNFTSGGINNLNNFHENYVTKFDEYCSNHSKNTVRICTKDVYPRKNRGTKHSASPALQKVRGHVPRSTHVSTPMCWTI